MMSPPSNSKSSRVGAAMARIKEKVSTVAKLRGNPLLARCDANPDALPLPVGTLVWAKDTGSIYWPACIAPSPTPDEDESKEDREQIDEISDLAFVCYIEPKFRVGLVSWAKVIKVNMLDAEDQISLVMDLNRHESKKKLRPPHSFHDSVELMGKFFDVESTERQGLMLKKYQEFSQERKIQQKAKIKSTKEMKGEVEVKPEENLPMVKETPTPTRRRASTKFSLRPSVTVPKPWNYTSPTPTATTSSTMRPGESSEINISAISTMSSKPRTKSLDGEGLKIWTEDKFARMNKLMKFESKEALNCSKCRTEMIDKNDYAFCHDYPFHKACLIEVGTKNTADGPVPKFKCEDCSESKCFVCKASNRPGQELPTKCSKCDLRFHRDCLVFNWPQADVMGSAACNGAITCPLHSCHVCKAEHFHDKVRNYKVPASKAIRCLYCLGTYHKNTCIPAGSANTIMRNQFMICPRHISESPAAKNRKLGCFMCQKKILTKDDTVSCTLCPLVFHASCVHGEFHLKAGVSLDELRKAFTCEGCHWGKFSLYGEVRWYQQPGSVYWPSMILYPKEAASRGVVMPGQFSVGYCGTTQYYDHGRRNYTVPLEIGSNEFLKRLNLLSNEKVTAALNEASYLIKLSESHRDQSLPPAEPEYKKIEKNIYRVPVCSLSVTKSKPNGKRTSGKGKDFDNEISTCDCGKAPGSEPVCTPDSGCYNRSTAMECDDKNCRGKERCQNRMFSTKPNGTDDLKMEYFISPCKKGFGLKSKVAFLEGSFLCEYMGEVISKNEMDWRKERKSDDDPLYFLEIDAATFIDAEYYGNLSRLMNHSCNPNCRIQKYFTAHAKPVVGIFAKRDILPGEELTFNYNFGSDSTFSFPCRCKSDNCKGVIGGGGSRGDEENIVPRGKKQRGKKSAREDGWRWEDECATCGASGELMMCDFPGCPKTHHVKCVGLVATPEGEWICPIHDHTENSNAESPPRKKRKLGTRVE